MKLQASAPPRVTVLMAAFNGETHVAKAVESIRRQTFRDFRLLIIDDASTDATREIVRSIADDRIELLCNARNLGLAASLNLGLDRIDTEFVARMDCDDLSHRRRLEWQVAFMEAHPDCGMSGTWLRYFGLRGQRGLSRYPVTAETVRITQLFSSPIAHATLIIRKRAVDASRLRYDPTFTRTEDFDFCSRATRNFPVLNLPRLAYYYRRHAGCATIRGADIMIREVQAIVVRQLEELGITASARELDLHTRACVGRGFESGAEIDVAAEWFERLHRCLRAAGTFDGETVEQCLGQQWFTLVRNSTRLGLAARDARRLLSFGGAYAPPRRDLGLFWAGIARHASRTALSNPARRPSDPPLVSVLMPMRNASRYLALAVRSIVEQTYGNFELLIVDDASTDDSQRIVESFKDPRIRCIRNAQCLGVAGSLNRAIEAARGKYLARMDADDISLPERFQRQVEHLEAHPTVAVLGTRVSYIGGPWGMVDLRPIRPGPSEAYLIFGTPVAHPTVMIRRAVLDEGGLRYRPDFSRSEDFDLWTRILPHGTLANLPDVLLRYRLHAQSVSSLHYETMVEQEQTIIARQMIARGINLDARELSLVRRITHCERMTTIEDLDAAQALLCAIVSADRQSPRAMRQAAAVAWLRLCCNCTTLGLRLWSHYRRSPLGTTVPGSWLAKRELAALCVRHSVLGTRLS